MIKNMTRKGLAIGSAIALGLTGLVSMPSQAAITDSTKVTLVQTSGEGFNITAVNGAAFQLSSTVANSVRGAATTGLKWKVTDPSEVLTATIQNGGVGAAAGSRAVDGSFIVNSADFAADLTLTMAAATTASYSTTVTAWYDDNNNNVIDADEYAATATVNFLAPSTVSSSVVVTSPIIGDTTFEGYIVTSPALNAAQAALPTVSTTWQGNAGNFAATVSHDSTNKRFKFVAERSSTVSNVELATNVVTVTTAAAHGLAVGESVLVAAVTATAINGTFTVASVPSTTTFTYALTGTDIASAADTGTVKVKTVAGSYSAQPSVGSNKGATSSFAVVAPVADDGTGSVTSSADVRVTSGNNTATVAAAVRPTVKAVTGSMFFIDEDEVAVVAGKPVRLTVTTITNATGVRLNGETKTQGQTLDVVTAAGGRVDFTVTTTSGVANDVITITGVAEGVAGTSTAITYTWTAVTNSFHDMNNAGSSAVRSIAVGGSYTFDFAITDNWAVAPTGDWRVKVAVSGNTVSETYPVMSNGRVSVTVTDSQISTGNVTVVATPQKQNASGVWEDSTVGGSGAPAAVTYTLIPGVQTSAAVSGSASNSATLASSTATLVAGDTRNSQLAVTTTGGFTISGVVTNATTGVARPGALVTVSGPSTILFYKGTKAAFGSLSFYAEATTGDYSFGAVSNIAQTESVVTVASQGGTREVKVTFQRALANSGVNLAVNAPASVTPGSTLVVKVKLTDKFGNPVRNNNGATPPVLEADHAVNVVYSGPGLIVGTVPNTTDANGEIELRVLLGGNDSGSATVTATFKNGNAATTNDIVVQRTITIGTAASVDGQARGWTRFLSASNEMKIYARDVVGAGKVQFIVNGREIAWIRAVDATDPKLNVMNDGMVRSVFVRDMLVGRNVIEIFVDGERLVRRIFTR